MNLRGGIGLCLIAIPCVAGGCGSNGGRPSGPFDACPMPAGERYDGKYYRVPDGIQMQLTQTGNTLSGTWDDSRAHRSARIEGTIEGCLAYFSWTETDEGIPGMPRTRNGRGAFRYMMPDPDATDQARRLDMVIGHGNDVEGAGQWQWRKSTR